MVNATPSFWPKTDRRLWEIPTYGNPMTKLNYCYTEFVKTVKMARVNIEASKVDTVWNDIIRTNWESMNFFDINLTHDILYIYKKYVEQSNGYFIPSVALAIFFQKIAGRGKSCVDHSILATNCLSGGLQLPPENVESVRKLILSTGDINYSKDILPDLFQHLNLSRIGCYDYDTFILNQEKIEKDCPQLTKKEFYSSQRAVYQHLLARGTIFSNMNFYTRFENNARENMTQYLHLLVEKINNLNFIKDLNKKPEFIEN